MSGKVPAGQGLERWSGILSFAVIRLGMSPCEFWDLSPFEWQAVVSAFDMNKDRTQIETVRRLMKCYPDDIDE